MRPTTSFALVLLTTILAGSTAFAQDDGAKIPSVDKAIPGHADQHYFLIGDTKREAPPDGFGLLLVLPGGDGSAAFNPFVKRIYANALPDGYLVAQLVAVPSKEKNQIVWPTEKSPDPKQAFTTESFIAAVIKDVKASQRIDDARVFTLSWSSSGPAAYTASLVEGTPVKGSFIAMSVFPIGQLQSSLPLAKGHRYYLLHSPDDKVCKYFFREMAAANLTRAGAKVETADYAGGHGWQGDVFGNIRKGVAWLEGSKQKK